MLFSRDLRRLFGTGCHSIVMASTMIERACAWPWPNPFRAWGRSNQQEQAKMRAFTKLGVPAATFVAAVILGAITTGSASAGEFCRQDVTGHMTGCGYSTMEQCQAAAAGIGGDCFRDPNLPANTASAGKSNPGNAFAYQPAPSRMMKRSRAHGNEANTNN
jgi:hypothetical protein